MRVWSPGCNPFTVPTGLFCIDYLPSEIRVVARQLPGKGNVWEKDGIECEGRRENTVFPAPPPKPRLSARRILKAKIEAGFFTIVIKSY